MASRALAFFMNRGMAQAFITWRDNAADQAEQREMASKALAFFMNRGMAQAFVTWRDNAADLAESRQSAGKALRFFMKTARAFEAISRCSAWSAALSRQV